MSSSSSFEDSEFFSELRNGSLFIKSTERQVQKKIGGQPKAHEEFKVE